MISETIGDENMIERPKDLFKTWPLHLDVLIEKQEDVFIAHCLQFDVITEGNTIDEAEEMIADAIFEYVTFALENNLTNFLFKPAPPESWQKLFYGNCKKCLRLDSQYNLPLVVEIALIEVESNEQKT